jgi:hypothetical protein
MDRELVVLSCGHVYSKATIVDVTLNCQACLAIIEGRTSCSCMDYRISKGWVYNDVTGLIRLRMPKDVLSD